MAENHLILNGPVLGGPTKAKKSIKTAEVGNLKNPDLGVLEQRAQLDYLQSLNRGFAGTQNNDARLQGAIQSFELAFRMQSELPKVMDLDGETK